MAAQCPCGRARAGCTYHDPALQPAPTPPQVAPMMGAQTVCLTGVRAEHAGKEYISPQWGPIKVLGRVGQDLYLCEVLGGQARVYFSIDVHGAVFP